MLRKFLGQRQASKYGVPFEDRKFWPGYYAFGRDKPLPNGAKVWSRDGHICPEMYKAKIGEVVPVYYDDLHRYLYRIKGMGHFDGSDHIVSPRYFHIEFAGRAALAAEKPQ